MIREDVRHRLRLLESLFYFTDVPFNVLLPFFVSQMWSTEDADLVVCDTGIGCAVFDVLKDCSASVFKAKQSIGTSQATYSVTSQKTCIQSISMENLRSCVWSTAL
jgi:hypothetical protein